MNSPSSDLSSPVSAAGAQQASGDGERPSLPQPQIVRLGRDLRQAGNDPHTITRESSGFGLSDWSRIKCSCGYRGPQRFEYEDDKCARLDRDENFHLVMFKGV